MRQCASPPILLQKCSHDGTVASPSSPLEHVGPAAAAASSAESLGSWQKGQSLHLQNSQWVSADERSQKGSQLSCIRSPGKNESHGTPTAQKSQPLHAHHVQCVACAATEHHEAHVSKASSPACSESQPHQSHPLQPHRWQWVALNSGAQ